MPHQNHMFHQVILTDVPKWHPANTDLTGKFPVLSGKDPRNGTLTTAGLSNQGNKASRRNIKVNSLKDLTILLIRKMHILERNIQAAFRQCLLSYFWLRKIQDPKYLVTGSHTVHGNMEKGAQEPERKKKFTGQKYNAERPGKAQIPVKELCHCHSHTNSRTAISHNIHHTGGIQLHGQDLHSNLTEPLGFRIHLICFLLIRLIDLQGSQALKVFQKGISKTGINAPVPVKKLLRNLLYHHNGNGNQRHADQKYHTGSQAYPTEDHKQRHRRDQAVKQLWEVFSEIGFQLLYSLCGNLHHLRGGNLLSVGSTKLQHFFIDLFPEDPFYIHTGQMGRPCPHPLAAKTDHHSQDQGNNRMLHPRRGHISVKHFFQKTCNGKNSHHL